MHDELNLEVRAAVSDVVIAYASAPDARDWRLLRDTLTNPVCTDYTSFDPDLDREMPAIEWVRRVTEGLSGFDVTRHLSSNHRHRRTDGDAVECVSRMQARQFPREDGEQASCTLFGHYVSTVVNDDGQWRICRCQLGITATEGGETVFARAVERYRNGNAS